MHSTTLSQDLRTLLEKRKCITPKQLTSPTKRDGAFCLTDAGHEKPLLPKFQSTVREMAKNGAVSVVAWRTIARLGPRDELLPVASDLPKSLNAHHDSLNHCFQFAEVEVQRLSRFLRRVLATAAQEDVRIASLKCFDNLRSSSGHSG